MFEGFLYPILLRYAGIAWNEGPARSKLFMLMRAYANG